MLLSRLQRERKLGDRDRIRAVAMPLEHAETDRVLTRVVDARRHIESCEPILHGRDGADARPEPVPLDDLEPDAARRARRRLIPDAATLVDVRFLLSARDVGIE